MFGEPGWHAAARGDAAVAVRIALRVAAGRPSPLTIDLVGSALLLCAAEGNAAAQVTLQYLRRRFVLQAAVKQDRTAAAGGVEVA
jgi:translation elongation factor EF-Ts